MSQSCEQGEEAARKRAAVETYARHERTLRRQARRFSLCADDADDALQRALEILLRKAPTTDPRELIRWTQTVVKHEALAVRRERERLLGGPPVTGGEDEVDWIALIPAEGAGPAERAERREAIARSREALQALKPQELRALSLLAEGYSYREIGEITGFSQTKINRCLAEGRERFRSFLARSEDGRRCEEMGPQLSAFCDGEASDTEQAEMREHLRACAHCRATLRAYRAVPAAAAALAPTLPFHRSLFERAHEIAVGLSSRFGGGDSAISGVAATGGSRGAGMAALAKILAVCAGTVGGAAACAATGVIPAPAVLAGGERTAIERQAEPRESTEHATAPAVEYEPEPPAPEPTPTPADGGRKETQPTSQETSPEPAPEPASSSGAVEYTPPPPPPPEAVANPSSSGAAGSSGGDASGEFGP